MLLGLSALTSACGEGGRLLPGDSSSQTHRVVLTATASVPIDVVYRTPHGHTVAAPTPGSSWTLASSAPNGRWVSFVAFVAPVPAGGVEEVSSGPRCAVSVDGHVVARDSGDGASCRLAGWVARRPSPKQAPQWVFVTLLMLSLAGLAAAGYRTIRLMSAV